MNNFYLPSSICRLLTVVLVSTLGVSACQMQAQQPISSAEIESLGMLALHGQQANAETRLRQLAESGQPVAERELGLLYLTRPTLRTAAMTLFEQAANNGDVESAFQLGELYRLPHVDHPADFAKAWTWYQKAADSKNANAALMLARMAKNGEGVVRNDALAVKWLQIASDLDNPQAMFLLSNAYLAGQGVDPDPIKARELLERSAEHDYPVAIHALAIAIQGGDMQLPKDDIRAGHLLKEATEERHNKWNSL